MVEELEKLVTGLNGLRFIRLNINDEGLETASRDTLVGVAATSVLYVSDLARSLTCRLGMTFPEVKTDGKSLPEVFNAVVDRAAVVAELVLQTGLQCEHELVLYKPLTPKGGRTASAMEKTR